MRKANPAFCDRSKSHKKLDPFNDRKMVHWLAENPFLVRSSAMVWLKAVRMCARCQRFPPRRPWLRAPLARRLPKIGGEELYRNSISSTRSVNTNCNGKSRYVIHLMKIKQEFATGSGDVALCPSLFSG